MNNLDKLCERADKLLDHLEKCLPTTQPEPEWQTVIAFRWRRQGNTGFIQPVTHPHRITLDALCGIDDQKQRIDQNTQQFVQGFSANNVLLTGARGTGKSSLIKALLNKYAKDGLRLIEVEKHHLIDLHDIVENIYQRPERFILFCDDLSFETDDPWYKALKVVFYLSIFLLRSEVVPLIQQKEEEKYRLNQITQNKTHLYRHSLNKENKPFL